jgi:hypothetical protein
LWHRSFPPSPFSGIGATLQWFCVVALADMFDFTRGDTRKLPPDPATGLPKQVIATVRLSLFAAVLVLVGTAGVAHAQSGADCQTPRPAVGAAIGRSSPYFEPSLGVGGLSRGGLHLAARADLPIAGAWRARVEGSATNWRLERQIYSADLRQVIATETVGRVEVRQIVALAGRQGGPGRICGYVLAGGGLYALGYQGASSYNPGFAGVAGIEFPGGPRGAVQVDVQLHLINTGTGGRYPIGSSAVLDARLSAGWLYRF